MSHKFKIGEPVRLRNCVYLTVRVHLAGLTENMTINVVVPRDDDGVREAAIARAKDFARQFASQT